MYRIGIVGAGIIAKPHVEAVMAHPKAILAAICDIDIEKARFFAEGTEAAVYTDYKEMAEKEELDAVILNLPHYLHMPVTVYFLERNVSVLVEKPMANNIEECRIMADAERKSNAKLAVGHLQRYYHCYREIKRIINEGTLGKLCSVTETRNIDYFNGRPKWFLDKKLAGGGIVMNYCAHTLDKFLYIVDEDIVKIAANTNNFLNDANVEAQAQVLLRTESGITAAFSYCAARLGYFYETYFYFTDGYAKITGGKYLWIGRKGQDAVKVDLDYDKVAIEWQFEDFIRYLDGESSDIVDAKQGERIMSIIDEIYRQNQ